MKKTYKVSIFLLGLLCLMISAINVQASTMYRLYNTNNSEHFYTINRNEKTNLVCNGWRYEGVAWRTSENGQPIYRVYHPFSGEHLYTVNLYEKNYLVNNGWRDEGLFGYSNSNQAPVYRLYRANVPQVASHLYTMNINERNQLIQNGWRDEGIAFYQELYTQGFDQGLPQPLVIDISGYQHPELINYEALANSVDGVIIRIQHGTIAQQFENEAQFINGEDRAFRTHLAELKKRGVPVAVYAYIKANSIDEMREEATSFYKLAQAYQPSFWWGDFEEITMPNMRDGAEAFRSQLKALGAQKVGAYIGHHVYRQMNLDTSKFDAIWIPYYGNNTGLVSGYPRVTNNYQLHQFTSNGHLLGYPKELDMDRLANPQTFSYLFG